MLLLMILPPLPGWPAAFLDAALLAVILFPILYLFVFRPMALHIVEREQMESALRQAQAELEARIQERTAELERINKDLQIEIAEREQAEDKMREAEARYRTLFEQSPYGVVIIDPQTSLPLEFNDVAHRQLGYSREEFAQLRVSDYEAAEKPAETEAHTKRVLRAGRDEFETRHRMKTGEIRNIHAIVQTIEVAVRPHFHCIFHDITDRKQIEEAVRQANDKLLWWVKELEERNREVLLLSEMSSLLQSCRTSAEAYTVIARFVQQLFPAESGALAVISPSRNVVEVVTTWEVSENGISVQTSPVFAPDECWALRRGRVHLVESLRLEPLCEHVRAAERQPCFYLCVPMMAQGTALGVLHLQRCPSVVPPEGGQTTMDGVPEWLSETKQRLAVTIGEQIALALANLSLREALRSQSIRDPLTGLYNRRYMEEWLERELYRAERAERSVGIIMLDLDHFKRFNDTHGHEAGDVVLRELGIFLKSRVRGGDVACRYGGEEFILLLPEVSLEETQQRAEELRNGVKNLAVRHRNQLLGTVTLSLGVAVFPEHGTAVEILMRAVDQALYRAKQAGRDRVMSAGE